MVAHWSSPSKIKHKGETLFSAKSLFGFSQDKKTIIAAGVGEDGLLAFDYGKFVSEKKFLTERYLDNQNIQ